MFIISHAQITLTHKQVAKYGLRRNSKRFLRRLLLHDVRVAEGQQAVRLVGDRRCDAQEWLAFWAPSQGAKRAASVEMGERRGRRCILRTGGKE